MTTGMKRGGIALVAAFAALLFAGCGGSTAPVAVSTSTPTATATATPSAPKGFTVYTDPSGYFQLDIPSTWTPFSLSGGSPGTGFNAPDKSADMVITYIAGTTLTSSDIATATKQFFQSESKSAGGNGTYTHVQGPSQVTVGGESWTKEEADVDIGAGSSPLHSVVLLADHNHNAFIIGYAAVDFATAQTNDYSTMLSTFTFLK